MGMGEGKDPESDQIRPDTPSDVKLQTSKNPSKNSKLRPKFEFAPLPKWELGLYFTVITAMFIVTWSTTAYISSLSPDRLLRGRRFKNSTVPLVNWPHYRDISDLEWASVYQYLPTMAGVLSVNSLLFEFLNRTCQPSISSENTKNEQIRKSIMIIYSLAASWALFLSTWDLGKMVLQSLIVFVFAKLIRYQICAWMSVATILFYNALYEEYNTTEGFISATYLQYSLFHYASYCIEEIIHQPTPGVPLLSQLINYIFYYTYLPFKTFLIMPYRLFQRRLNERQFERRNWRHIVTFALRLIFWYYVYEIVCHYCYFQPIVRNPVAFPDWAEKSRIVLGSVYFCIGISFHMKYVVIFGVPSLFLHIDKMQPERPPICVARVSLYSRIWREFDRGLYLFIKEGVYKPICRPTFSIQRKIIAGFTVFLVVLIWHNASRKVIIWILMNVFVLVARGLALILYNRNDRVYNFCHQSLSPLNLRRLLAFLQMPLVIISLISIFYFLAGGQRGDEVAYCFLYEDWIENFGLNAFGQMALGYIFAQFCIQVNIWVEARQEREDREQELGRQRKKVEAGLMLSKKDQ